MRAIEEAMATAQDGGDLEDPAEAPVPTGTDYAKALEEAYLSGAEDGVADESIGSDSDAVLDSDGSQDPLPEIDLDDLLLGASSQEGDGPVLNPYAIGLTPCYRPSATPG